MSVTADACRQGNARPCTWRRLCRPCGRRRDVWLRPLQNTCRTRVVQQRNTRSKTPHEGAAG
eukprot:8341991-Prorocentrum_lima.AAC.1